METEAGAELGGEDTEAHTKLVYSMQNFCPFCLRYVQCVMRIIYTQSTKKEKDMCTRNIYV